MCDKPKWIWYLDGTEKIIGIIIGLAFLSILLLLLGEIPEILDYLKGPPQDG